MKYIKTFGKERTGTRYLRFMVEKNFQDVDVLAFTLGNKHGAPLSFEDMAIGKWHRPKVDVKRVSKICNDIIKNGYKIHPIILIKNPYSWYLSIKSVNPERFVAKYSFNAYNKLYREYKDFDNNYKDPFVKPIYVKYEDFIRDERKMLKYIAGVFDIKVNDDIKIINKYYGNSNTKAKSFTENRRKFYLSDDFGLDMKELKEITSLVDWDLMKFYGYNPKI